MTSNNAFAFLSKEQAIRGEEAREICSQRGKDGKLRHLNWTGNRRKYADYESDGSASSEGKTDYYTPTGPQRHLTRPEPQEIESEAGDHVPDLASHRSVRYVAAERERAVREPAAEAELAGSALEREFAERARFQP